MTLDIRVIGDRCPGCGDSYVDRRDKVEAWAAGHARLCERYKEFLDKQMVVAYG